MIHYESRDQIAVVTIDRPSRRNAVDPDTASALTEAFERFDGDDELHVAVLTGAEGTFCAGADLSAIAEDEASQPQLTETPPMGPTRLRLTKPVIAAIEGYAVGGGLELALWCDLRVTATDAIFAVSNRRWGLPTVDGGTVRLPRLIGHGRAMDLLLTGRRIDGNEAARIGLVNQVVPPGDALAAALELADALASLPQTGMRHDRMSALEQWALDDNAALANEANYAMATVAAFDPSTLETRSSSPTNRAGQ